MGKRRLGFRLFLFGIMTAIGMSASADTAAPKEEAALKVKVQVTIGDVVVIATMEDNSVARCP